MNRPTPEHPASPRTFDDPAVEAEWRKLEAERLAEEIEEARDDVAAAGREQRRPPWTWLAMVAALAAGVLAAAGLNLLMRQSGRETVPPPAVDKSVVVVPAAEPADVAPVEPAGESKE
ncbi:MAG: hypothetical protein K8S94_01935 [Planctomycetia bacterium]|nr:hypothetical protein [Planctomycetia bacterium]